MVGHCSGEWSWAVLVKLLLEKAVDVNSKDSNGRKLPSHTTVEYEGNGEAAEAKDLMNPTHPPNLPLAGSSSLCT
jgi:hypothetical protein